MWRLAAPQATGHSAVEIQFRFLMAASPVGVIELQFDADGCARYDSPRGRDAASDGAPALHIPAYTYRDLPPKKYAAIVEALKTPMQEV